MRSAKKGLRSAAKRSVSTSRPTPAPPPAPLILSVRLACGEQPRQSEADAEVEPNYEPNSAEPTRTCTSNRRPVARLARRLRDDFLLRVLRERLSFADGSSSVRQQSALWPPCGTTFPRIDFGRAPPVFNQKAKNSGKSRAPGRLLPSPSPARWGAAARRQTTHVSFRVTGATSAEAGCRGHGSAAKKVANAGPDPAAPAAGWLLGRRAWGACLGLQYRRFVFRLATRVAVP